MVSKKSRTLLVTLQRSGKIYIKLVAVQGYQTVGLRVQVGSRGYRLDESNSAKGNTSDGSKGTSQGTGTVESGSRLGIARAAAITATVAATQTVVATSGTTGSNRGGGG